MKPRLYRSLGPTRPLNQTRRPARRFTTYCKRGRADTLIAFDDDIAFPIWIFNHLIYVDFPYALSWWWIVGGVAIGLTAGAPVAPRALARAAEHALCLETAPYIAIQRFMRVLELVGDEGDQGARISAPRRGQFGWGVRSRGGGAAPSPSNKAGATTRTRVPRWANALVPTTAQPGRKSGARRRGGVDKRQCPTLVEVSGTLGWPGQLSLPATDEEPSRRAAFPAGKPELSRPSCVQTSTVLRFA